IEMNLQIQSKSRFLDLHLNSGLHDWDMNEEIKLTTTTDQFYHGNHYTSQTLEFQSNGLHPLKSIHNQCTASDKSDEKRTDQYLAQWHYARVSRRPSSTSPSTLAATEPEVHPNLWLMVNPSLACPIKYPSTEPKVSSMVKVSVVTEQSLCPPIMPEETSLPESPVDTSPSSEYQLTDEDDASSVDVPVCRKVKGARKARAAPRMSCGKMPQKRRVQRALQDIESLKSGAWPRPPVNYCILIALALSSSRSGSLNVQQIYNFTRDHFPFFLTAPDGWKNTIRHNLCFSNSFRKTQQQVSGDGKRKSCLWHLTLDGRQRLRDELYTLTEDSFRMLRRSMNYPGKPDTGLSA
ncbi:hypothetical protein DNTS_022019, partial [Danionella cerebrum]